jgi:hypothetical protein
VSREDIREFVRQSRTKGGLNARSSPDSFIKSQLLRFGNRRLPAAAAAWKLVMRSMQHWRWFCSNSCHSG